MPVLAYAAMPNSIFGLISQCIRMIVLPRMSCGVFRPGKAVQWIRIEGADVARLKVKCFLLLVLITLTVSCRKRDNCIPEITKQPGNAIIHKGATVTLRFTARSSGVLSYQWYEAAPGESILLQGQNEPSITVQPERTTTYFAWVYGVCGKKRGQKVTDVAIVTVR